MKSLADSSTVAQAQLFAAPQQLRWNAALGLTALLSATAQGHDFGGAFREHVQLVGPGLQGRPNLILVTMHIVNAGNARVQRAMPEE
jgi:hypothetical protein